MCDETSVQSYQSEYRTPSPKKETQQKQNKQIPTKSNNKTNKQTNKLLKDKAIVRIFSTRDILNNLFYIPE